MCEMSHQYRADDEQGFAYSRSPQYGTSHPPYQSYPSQPLAPFNRISTDASSSMNSPYSPSPSLLAQSPHGLHGTGHPYSQQYAQSRYPASPRYFPVQDLFHDVEIESQDSCNENSLLSEPVLPALEGFPDVREFDQLMKNYVDELSIKKQDKALIHARRARNIRTVLQDPKDTAVESAQFRFWVKKMFKLEPNDVRTPESKRLICHEGKPVAIREKLFKILTKAHQLCQHGGRDKTSAQVRRIYSWVPKELISRFVKICPTCRVRRTGSRISPPRSQGESPKFDTVAHSQSLLSPPDSRGEPVVSRPGIGGISRSEHPSEYGYSWGNTQNNVQNQYHSNMPLGPPPGWGTLPRSVSGVVDSGMGGGNVPMPPNHYDYSSTYDGTHGMPGHHHY